MIIHIFDTEIRKHVAIEIYDISEGWAIDSLKEEMPDTFSEAVGYIAETKAPSVDTMIPTVTYDEFMQVIEEMA
jgi:hypothetical protein